MTFFLGRWRFNNHAVLDEVEGQAVSSIGGRTSKRVFRGDGVGNGMAMPLWLAR